MPDNEVQSPIPDQPYRSYGFIGGAIPTSYGDLIKQRLIQHFELGEDVIQPSSLGAGTIGAASIVDGSVSIPKLNSVLVYDQLIASAAAPGTEVIIEDNLANDEPRAYLWAIGAETDANYKASVRFGVEGISATKTRTLAWVNIESGTANHLRLKVWRISQV